MKLAVKKHVNDDQFYSLILDESPANGHSIWILLRSSDGAKKPACIAARYSNRAPDAEMAFEIVYNAVNEMNMDRDKNIVYDIDSAEYMLAGSRSLSPLLRVAVALPDGAHMAYTALKIAILEDGWCAVRDLFKDGYALCNRSCNRLKSMRDFLQHRQIPEIVGINIEDDEYDDEIDVNIYQEDSHYDNFPLSKIMQYLKNRTNANGAPPHFIDCKWKTFSICALWWIQRGDHAREWAQIASNNISDTNIVKSMTDDEWDLLYCKLLFAAWQIKPLLLLILWYEKADYVSIFMHRIICGVRGYYRRHIALINYPDYLRDAVDARLADPADRAVFYDTCETFRHVIRREMNRLFKHNTVAMLWFKQIGYLDPYRRNRDTLGAADVLRALCHVPTIHRFEVAEKAALQREWQEYRDDDSMDLYNDNLDELDRVYKGKRISKGRRALLWWQGRAVSPYPLLAKLAKPVIKAVISSCSVERAFSTVSCMERDTEIAKMKAEMREICAFARLNSHIL